MRARDRDRSIATAVAVAVVPAFATAPAFAALTFGAGWVRASASGLGASTIPATVWRTTSGVDSVLLDPRRSVTTE